jgi:hypothetical protein
MLITTKAIYDIETLQLIEWHGYEYSGAVDKVCSSGGSVAQNDKDLQSAQLAQTKLLNQNYATTFAEQQSVLQSQKAKLEYIAANPIGYTPAQLHTATTSINDTVAKASKNALGSAAAFAASHGGADIGGGTVGQVAGAIGSEAAQAKSSQLGALSQQNEELKQKNFWNAISGLNQVGAEYGGSSGQSIGGSGSLADSSVAAGSGALAAQNAGWQHLTGVLSGIGGIAAGLTGTYASEQLHG